MEFLRTDLKIDFLGYRYPAIVVSVVLVLLSLAVIAFRGLNFGIDFTGGVLLEVGYAEAADLPAVRKQLEDAGVVGAQVQNFGAARDVMIRLMPGESDTDSKVGEAIMEILRAENPDVELRRVEFVGPQVGDELAEQGALAMLFALLMILAYVAFRFQWKFSLGAVAALIHDVIITVGFFSALQISFDLSVLAAVLAVVGYSLNDTIVVFDRIRENFRGMRKGEPIDIMNLSLNQTLARTLMTSGTTLLVLLVLFLFGGATIHAFSIALLVGILVGTYSSIYVASALALELKLTLADLSPPKKEELIDEMP